MELDGMTRDELIEEIKRLRSVYDTAGRSGNVPNSREETLRDIFERVPVGLYRSSPEGNIIDVNSSTIRILGYQDRESFMKVHSQTLYADPDDHEKWKREIFEKGTLFNFEVPMKKQNGEIIWINDYARAIYDENGDVKYYEGAVIDITEEKRLREALRISEENYRDLVDKSKAAIVSDNLGGTFEFFNSRFAELFGYSREEMEKLSISELVHPEDLDFVLQRHVNRYESRGESDEYKFRGIRKDGSIIHLQCHVVPVVEGGRVVRTSSYIWDITELKNSQENMDQLNDILRLTNRVLRHDIGNNLTSAETAIELFRMKGEDRTLDIAHRSIQKCMDTIENMRILEGITHTGSELMITNASELIRDALVHHSIDIEIEGDCRIKVDEGFGSVIDNLVRNAVVHGKADRVRIEIEKAGNLCRIRVIDFGEGIPEDIKKFIFEEGYKSPDSKGSGLGLYIIKKTMERYGGSISVEDNRPSGAVFTLNMIAVD
ncbi:MAG: PAS domain S-box protein [Thermoplasmatota archaeon]